MLQRDGFFGRRNEKRDEKQKSPQSSEFDSPAAQVRNALAPSVAPPTEDTRKEANHTVATPAPSVAAPAPNVVPTAPTGDEAQGSQLIVGPNIKLKGVEITDCDTLVVEGHVEATMDSRTIRIAPTGTFSGTAGVDIAEINGVFCGELAARVCMKVYATGRVSGKIRYGKLVVEEGGEISGDIKKLSDDDRSVRAQHAPEKPVAIPTLIAKS